MGIDNHPAIIRRRINRVNMLMKRFAWCCYWSAIRPDIRGHGLGHASAPRHCVVFHTRTSVCVQSGLARLGFFLASRCSVVLAAEEGATGRFEAVGVI